MHCILGIGWWFFTPCFERFLAAYYKGLFPLPRGAGGLHNTFRVMLMSSDKHTTLAGFVTNKNVIKPCTPVLLFPPLSQPFNSPSLHDVSQIYWTDGRQGTRWRRARTKCSYSSLPTALSTLCMVVCLCGHRMSQSSGVALLLPIR